jgi:hypothetical protein
MKRRWDIDDVGHGVASARNWASEARRLAEAMEAPDWVAEQPEHHLLPHIERACALPGAPLRLVGWSVDDGGVLELRVAHREPDATAGLTRAAALALLGEVAEARTFTIERSQARVFEMVTGMLDGDGEFAGHGHVVRLIVEGGR